MKADWLIRVSLFATILFAAPVAFSRRAGKVLRGHVPPPSAVRVVPNTQIFDFEKDS